MIRTQIQLPEEDHEALRGLASRQRRSMADCIREAVRCYLASARVELLAVEEVAGRFSARSVDDLKSHDRWLADAVAEPKPRP